MSREPLGQVAITAGVILAAAGLFGLNVTVEQADAITYVIAAATPLISSLLVWVNGRNRVTPVVDPRDAQGRLLAPDE